MNGENGVIYFLCTVYLPVYLVCTIYCLCKMYCDPLDIVYYILYTIYYLVYITYIIIVNWNNLQEYKLFTSTGNQTQNFFMRNKKIIVLHTNAPTIDCTVKIILFLSRLLHESIVYWASEIAAVQIVHAISSHDWVGISRKHHALAVR